LQENVFIESSRPKYLENLHSEALEGLKMMQQEESNNGVDCRDNSTVTVHTDGEGGGFITDSTIGDTTSVVSVQSSVSTRSSRSGLTRQAESTFRPLNSGKKSEKGKTRKRHRKTIGGIPQHVQMELGLDRGGWAVSPRLEEEVEVYNGETDDSSAPDGPLRTAESPQDVDGSSRQKKDQIKQSPAAHADDMALLHSLVSDSSGGQRPQSLAVPWMTTANSLQKPPSTVMSMSPQAAYMSKIIPNAVLPPSIDVVEISRGRSRNSVKTVSHGSLLLSSPAASRSSSRASSSRTFTATPQNLSDNSGWSNSDSTETLVSGSSTVSSSTTPRQQGSQDGDRKAVLASSSSRAPHTSNGLIAINRDEVKKEGPFGRSLSVMKPKKAPPPPSRSYSLHNKMKRRSRDLAGIGSGESPRRIISTEENQTDKKPSPLSSSIMDSPGYNADTSSLEDSTGSAKRKPESLQGKVVSPSSGYSSQDGSSKPKHGSSTRHKRGILAKLQRLFPGSTSALPVTPAHTLPELSESTKSEISVDTSSVSPSVRALIELFNIPPPPKIHAPPPPPPEVWAHSKRSFELLLGPPAPDNICAIIKKNPKEASPSPPKNVTPPPISVQKVIPPPPPPKAAPPPPPPPKAATPPPPKAVTPPPPPKAVTPPPPPKAVTPPPPPKAVTPPPPPKAVTPPPEEDLPNIKQESSPASTEEQSPQGPPTTVVQQESPPAAPPSLLQTAELQSLSSSSEAPQVQKEPDTEVIMRNKTPGSTSSTEAPQKPIRKSLIINSPSPASPPALNLQEAIRLRTAARSLGGPSSRLNLHSPTSPPDLCKSPSSTASFIFAKSSKKVVLETKPVAATQKNQDVSSPTKVDGETELSAKGAKVPPPVARKP
uniref:KIAA1522 n=1 Tax=Tetraodon nigroviridis TaxID=99883 RepID=H3DJC2_TETNG